MARVELDVRVRVGDGDWINPASGEFTGDSAGEIAAGISGALRALADEIDTAAQEEMAAGG